MDGDTRHRDRDARAAPGAGARRFARAGVAHFGTPSGAEIEAAVAAGLSGRLLGLAALDAADAPALLIPRCRSVHTFWMRFAVDVVFVALPEDPDGGPAPVVDVHRALGPRRLASAPRGATEGRGGSRVAALELSAGAAEAMGIEAGRVVECALGRRDRTPPRRRRDRRRDRD